MVRGDTGGKSCLASWVAFERWKDGGSSSLGMRTRGRLAMVASAKVGRHSSIAMSLGTWLSSCKMEEWQEEMEDSFDA